MNSTQVLCAGGSTGSAIINVTGGTQPFTYKWYNSDSVLLYSDTNEIRNFSTGDYSVIFVDANGCSGEYSFSIEQPQGKPIRYCTKWIIIYIPVLNASMSITQVQCADTATGSANVTTTGGVPPYVYQWFSGDSQLPFEGNTTQNLFAGAYSVHIIDANGCVNAINFTIIQPPGILYFLNEKRY